MYILSQPAIYSLELTAVCNNCCAGCSNVYAKNRDPGFMSALQWEKLLASFAPEAVQIRLTGGEPSLHPEFFQILTAATRYDARVTIFTNGRWRHPLEFVQQLQGWPRLTGLLISLHGASALSHETFSGIKGSFAETVKNIRLAVQYGIRVSLSTILTCQSIKEIDAVVALSQELGVAHATFNRYLGAPLPGIEPTPEEYLHAIRQIEMLIQSKTPVRYGIGIPQCFAANDSEGCLAGVAYAAIDPWGNLRPCAHADTIVGSLHTTSLIDLWHSPQMNTWREQVPAECPRCPAFSVCHGGCRAVPGLRPEQRDPLRGARLNEFKYTPAERLLPENGKPSLLARIRPESFGYVLLGNGRMYPVRAESFALLEALDGQTTFLELNQRFGQRELNLLGELWSAGMISI